MEHSTEDGRTQRPRYRVDGFTTSSEGENRDFVLLHARPRGKLLYVEVSPSSFRNSPSMTKHFYKYFKVASSGLDALDADLIYEFYDWALSPFLSAFSNPEPQPQEIRRTTAMLQDYLYPETYDCELKAVDDKLFRGRMERREIEEFDSSFDIPDDIAQAMEKFRSVHPSQVEDYPEFQPEHPDDPDSQPHRVRVSGQTLFFESFRERGPDNGMKEIMKYLKIAKFGADLRTSRLYGIVRDDNDPLIRLLYYYIDEESNLKWAVGPVTPASLKERWSAQMTHTLKT
jgi:hypothetical protein